MLKMRGEVLPKFVEDMGGGWEITVNSFNLPSQRTPIIVLRTPAALFDGSKDEVPFAFVLIE